MGNHKFRLSDMIPNAWFYKLRDRGHRTASTTTASAANKKKSHPHQQQYQLSRNGSTHQKPRQSASRKSYYYARENPALSSPKDETRLCNSASHSKSSSLDSLFPEPPRVSAKKELQKRRQKKKVAVRSPRSSKSSVSAAEYHYRSSLESTWTTRSEFTGPHSPSPPEGSVSPEMRSDRALPTELFEEKASSWSLTGCNYEPRDIVIDIDETKQLAAKIENSDHFVTISDLELRPILTKPKRSDDTRSSTKTKPRTSQDLEQSRPRQSASGAKGFLVSSPGVRVRVNSPGTGSKRFSSASGRRSLSSTSSSSSSKKSSTLAESMAIVKSSVNPREDFKQSMVEMIVAHDIKTSRDLEELLACYLSLNQDEYHDLIISVFKQIWFQLSKGLHKKKNTIRDNNKSVF